MALTTLICKRCGFGSGDNKWIPRTEHPGRCPSCGSAKWETERAHKEYGRRPKKIRNLHLREL